MKTLQRRFSFPFMIPKVALLVKLRRIEGRYTVKVKHYYIPLFNPGLFRITQCC
jgi:hypothetical protein